jgi:predicted ATPase with chaperone activity
LNVSKTGFLRSHRSSELALGGEPAARWPVRNLAPADLKNVASGFVRPIALGLLHGGDQADIDRSGNDSIAGEWVLNDETRTARDIPSVARAIADLEASDETEIQHIARPSDTGRWTGACAIKSR